MTTAAAKTKTVSLLEVAQQGARYFMSRDGETFAETSVPHKRVLPLMSAEFDDWLIAQYFTETRRPAPSSALTSTKQTLRALARGAGETREVFRRVAIHEGNCYLDACDEQGHIIEIKPSGWRIIKNAPVTFVRHQSMCALPLPRPGGRFSDVEKIANLPPGATRLVRAWLIECMRTDTPHVSLVIYGTQGSAKSTLQSMLRDLIDPSVQNLRTAPRALADLHASAQSSHMLSFENVSELSGALQDHLCATLTGAATAGRTLFTNSDETLLKLQRPLVMNGITAFVTRPDLQDRCVVLELPVIDEKTRRTATAVRARFEAARPKLLGALLTTFAKSLALLPEVKTQKHNLPRMADFALLGEAVTQSLGQKPGSFIASYNKNRLAGIGEVIDASPVGTAIRRVVGSGRELSGPIGQIKSRLERRASKAGHAGGIAGWPKTDRAFSEELKRITPALAQFGIAVEKGKRTADGYPVRIHKRK